MSEWLKVAENFERFLSCISKFKKLECVRLNYLKMDGEMIARTIAVLTSSQNTIRELELNGVNWDTEEARTHLLQFIAFAPKLQKCDVRD